MSLQVAKITPYWYTPKSQLKEKKPCQFKLQPLSGETFVQVFEQCEHINGHIKPNTEARQLLWSHGITNWKNFQDGSKAVKFSEENKQLIPFNELIELANEILSASMFSGEERKN